MTLTLFAISKHIYTNFDEWAASVMAGIKRMDNDSEYRAKIDAMSAAASPKTTIRGRESLPLKGADTAHEHPR